MSQSVVSFRHMIAQVYIKLKERKTSVVIFAVFLCAYLAVLSVMGLNRPAWGDEAHFVETVRQFGQGITLDLIKTYGEMSTPFPFVMYALWGKLFGFSLPALRTFSLVIAATTAAVFWQLCNKILHDTFSALVCTIFLFINPYIVGLSIFVFPDMLTILCLVTGVLALVDDRPVLLSLACALGLLSRQYFIFFPAAVFCYCALKYWLKSGKPLKTIIAVSVSILPTLLLFWLWKGISPQNSLKELYLGNAFSFSPTALVLYIILLGAYLSPLILVRWRKYYRSWPIAAIAVVLSGIYFIYPVKVSLASLNNGITTVGYLHRFLSAVLGRYTNWAFFILFLLSLPVLLEIIRMWIADFKNPSREWWLKLSILLFLIIMPFSYLWWEKYFVLILPIAILEIYRPAS